MVLSLAARLAQAPGTDPSRRRRPARQWSRVLAPGQAGAPRRTNELDRGPGSASAPPGPAVAGWISRATTLSRAGLWSVDFPTHPGAGAPPPEALVVATSICLAEVAGLRPGPVGTVVARRLDLRLPSGAADLVWVGSGDLLVSVLSPSDAEVPTRESAGRQPCVLERTRYRMLLPWLTAARC